MTTAPTTTRDPLVEARCSPALAGTIEAVAEADGLSRSEVVRELLAVALNRLGDAR